MASGQFLKRKIRSQKQSCSNGDAQVIILVVCNSRELEASC